MVHELGLNRRKAGWFLSISSGDCGKPNVYERIFWVESLVYELFLKEYSSAATFAESITESISSKKLVLKFISHTFQIRTSIGARCTKVTFQLGRTNQASIFSFFDPMVKVAERFSASLWYYITWVRVPPFAHQGKMAEWLKAFAC